MPHWPARRLSGSHTPASITSDPNSKALRVPLRQTQPPEGQDPPLHGVPILASQNSVAPSHPKQRHGRSRSSSFISVFGNGKRLDKSTDTDFYDGSVVLSDDSSHDPSGLLLPDSMTAANGGPLQRGENDHVTGKCVTCGCVMKWLKELDVFRCGTCLMINDLKPSTGLLNGANMKDAKQSAGFSTSAAAQKVPLISLDKVREIIDQCLLSYLQSRFENIPAGMGESQQLRGILGGKTSRPPASPTKADVDPVHHMHKRIDVPSPARAPPPPPVQGHSTKANDYGTNDPEKFPQDSSHLMFRPLEKYIITCFTSIECLNRSFSNIKFPKIHRAISEGDSLPIWSPMKPEECVSAGNPLPTLDAKTLLLGDFAENGMWWTGRNHIVQHQSQRPLSRAPDIGKEDRLSLKSPHISWTEVDDCYHAIISAGESWKAMIPSLQRAQEAAGSVSSPSKFTAESYADIAKSICEASAHVQRTLLKACENLLRRPGRPLQRPEDCRFLLIILANPLLQASDSPVTSQPTSTTATQASRETDCPPGRLTVLPSRPSVPLHRTSPNSRTGVAGKHSGIVKRVLGLMANLPSGCHNYLVHWFSRFSETRFRRLVELVGSFVNYRLTRQHGRKRSESPDPHGGLVPNLSGRGAGTSAQLHAALGLASKPKSPEKDDGARTYNDDWQIRVSAKVMSLLFAANFLSPHHPRDLGKGEFPLGSRSRSDSSPCDRDRGHRQILPTSSFYSTLLDYIDLVADFELWESRRGKFSFCQYPMFLSIWAKIRIMEHDARRQMEIKAREAFFDSIMSRKAINQYLVLKVRRDCLVEDSLRGVSEVVGTGQEEIKKGLRIQFLGEEGLDSGGLRKEWFLLLVREVFDPDHGLFVYDDESHYCYFNPNSFETSDQFFLVGVVMGLAIYNSTILDVALPPFAFRKLLASAPSYTGPATSSVRSTFSYTLDDLAEFRPSLASGLRSLLEFDGNVEETFCRDFVIQTERYGQPIEVPLCPSGANRPVTNSNRHEFVDLYVKHLLEICVARQYDPFKRGFFSVCEGNALTLFRPEEIELLVRGSDEPLDVATLQSVAVYDGWSKGVPPADEPVVRWFWESFAKASSKDQRKLLSFITSSDRIPAMGATSLVIKITCLGEHSNRFPVARTCFNMLGLFRYRLRETLEEKLWRAVAESEGFGIK